MSHHTKKRRVIAAVAGLGLLATALPAAASGLTDVDTRLEGEGEKVASTVTAALEDEGSTDVWIVLNGRPDLSAAQGMAWEERGRYVHDTLTAAAEEAQADVVADLEAAGADYRAFWINNSVFVRDADDALVSGLASSGDVAAVVADFEVEAPDPEDGEPVPAPLETTWGLDAIGVPTIWEEYDQRGEGIVVSALDSGVEASHPGLVEKYRGTETGSDDYNWFDSRGLSDTPVDPDPGGHGTHVTGTIVGGEGENEIGVAPDAQFIGTAGCCTDGADVVETMQWLLAPTPVGGGEGDPDQRPHVVNNSWGYSFLGLIGIRLPSDDPQFVPVGAGIQAWNEAGIFNTWATGNFAQFEACDSLSSPAWNDVAGYTVANVQEDGTIAPSSSRGPGEDGEPGPDITAPGSLVISTVPGGGYEPKTGTSMAAPHVAGAVALLWAEFPYLEGDVEATAALLDQTAVDTEDPTCGGPVENNETFGEGVLDVPALFTAAEEAQPPSGTTVDRWGGAERYDTARLISQAYPEGVDTVYVATGQDYADSLAGAPSAAKGVSAGFGTMQTPDGEPAPVLLTQAENLPKNTVAALDELEGVTDVVVLGGETRISSDVATQLAAWGEVTRVEGDDRYDTAANLAAQWGEVDTVVVASGEEDAYPDALTGGAWAAWNDAPVLLTKSGSVPTRTAEALAELAPENVVVLGGTDAITEATYAELGGTLRVAGDDRYETGVEISSGLEPGLDVVYVAFGADYPDALAGSALAGSQDAPVLLTRGDTLSTVTAEELVRLAPAEVIVLGGEDVIEPGTYAAIEALFPAE